MRDQRISRGRGEIKIEDKRWMVTVGRGDEEGEWEGKRWVVVRRESGS